MTLTEIRTRILSKLGRAGDTTLNDDITYALETVQDEIQGLIDFPETKDLVESSLLLVANTQEYNLPNDFLRMIQIWDTAEYNQELRRIFPNEYKTFLGDVTGETGTNPIYYDILDSTTSGSDYVKKIRLFPYPASILNGKITTFAQITGVPGSFADYTTTVNNTVLITDVAHGLITGMQVTIAGTVNYNGTFTVTVVTADTFYITANYVAEAGGGTWTATGTQITDVDHGLATGNSITIAGTTNYNGAYNNLIKIDDDNFYISATYVAEAGAVTKTWIQNKYIPFVYVKKIPYLSSSATENILSYKYPNLFIEGGAYYLYRDNIYRDQPEKIAFRRGEYYKAVDIIKKSISEVDRIHMVMPKRLIGSPKQLFTTQYSGYTS